MDYKTNTDAPYWTKAENFAGYITKGAAVSLTGVAREIKGKPMVEIASPYAGKFIEPRYLDEYIPETPTDPGEVAYIEAHYTDGRIERFERVS